MKKLIGLLAVVALLLVGCGSAGTVAPAKEGAAPVVEKQWVVTNTWEGEGTKTTENFTITKNTRINWETTNEKGIFQVYVQDADGNPAEVAANMQGIGKDTTYIHVPNGQYSLNINSAFTPWKITVEQQQ